MHEEIPKLQILPVDQLVLHEKHDEQRTRPLIERMHTSGVQINPVIVAALKGNGGYVVLDGANRTTAIREMGIPHILAQVVDADSPSLELHTWNHALWETNTTTVLDSIRALPDVHWIPTELQPALAKLANQQAAAFMHTVGGEKLLAIPTSPNLTGLLDALNVIFEAYNCCARFDRVRAIDLRDVEGLQENVAALTVYPPFQVYQVLGLALKGHLFPAGITRFTVAPRALRVNYAITGLIANNPLEEKNARLTKWIQERMGTRGVRFYAEPTVLFDE